MTIKAEDFPNIIRCLSEWAGSETTNQAILESLQEETDGLGRESSILIRIAAIVAAHKWAQKGEANGN